MAECFAMADLNSGENESKKGACVVDPKENRVLACCADNRHAHPLQHAAMLAVDLVAKGQGGGAWKNDEGKYVSCKIVCHSCLNSSLSKFHKALAIVQR